ncbi:phage major capsid protein [Bacillus sp. 03113]|uniref:phage major capsid protein n=1 Tax=Bacillus sp. 03113 TaxID=2578211 RepID=UPI0015E8DB60|nr:phage major capsid protein [Bacillus sp. 03113]
MGKIVELLQKRANLWEQAKEIHEKSVTEQRSLSGEEQTQYDKITADIDGLTATIDREKRMEEQRAEMEKAAFEKKGQKKENNENRNIPTLETEEYRDAYKSWLKTGIQGLDTEQRTILDNGRQTFEARALSAVTGASGGFTVPQGFYNEIISAMKPFGGMRQSRATILRTGSGNDLPIPTNDDTANVGAIVGENAAAGNATDPVFAQKILKAYKYTSKTFLIPIELLQDSAFDVEAFIRQKITERIARILNQHFTTGTGSGQPQGVVTGSTLGKEGATGQTGSITYDDLVDLQHSVNPLYRANAEWMFNDNSLKIIRKLKDSNGLPLWQPSLTAAEPDTILGKPYRINTDMADMAASAKSILFGDFANYFIRDVLDLMIVRISEKYIENGQIGFIAFSRHDALLIDAGQGPIKYYANPAS